MSAAGPDRLIEVDGVLDAKEPGVRTYDFSPSVVRISRFAAALLIALGLVGLARPAFAGATLVPSADNDEYSVSHTQVLSVPAPGVRDGDVIPPGYTIALVTGTSSGVLVFNTDGSFTYDPFDSFVGDDTFVYRLEFVPPPTPTATATLEPVSIEVRPAGAVAQATVTIHVTNSPPTPADDNYTTAQDTPLVVAAPEGVFANDNDPDGDPIEISGVSDVEPNGAFDLDPETGAFMYTPNPGFVGVDTIQYFIVDVLGGQKAGLPGSISTQGFDGFPATVTIVVTGVDTPTPEPTLEPTSTPKPGEPTATPAPPAPTATTQSPVNELPDTGAAPSGSGGASGTAVWLAVLLCGGLAFAGFVANRRATRSGS